MKEGFSEKVSYGTSHIKLGFSILINIESHMEPLHIQNALERGWKEDTKREWDTKRA